MGGSRVTRDALSISVLLVLLIGGEAPALFGVKYLVIPGVTAKYPDLSGTRLFVVECIVAGAAIFLVGSVLGLISVLINRRKELSKGWIARWLERHGWSREQWLARALKKGEPVGFVLGSYLGGGWGIGWWYARKGHPYAIELSCIGAAVLAAPSSVLWVAAFNPMHPYAAPAIAAAILLLAWPMSAVVRSVRRGTHARR